MMQSKTSAPPRRPSFSRDVQENGSLVQVLSQRLTNMEQQLFLLRDDLKNAVGTLKEKDRIIQTLQNRIALAERRRELEEAGQPVDDSLTDVSGGIVSKSNTKRDVLENEVVTLAKKLEEMEKFFGDYGLAWVKEDALDERDPKNLWLRKSNIHYTPDFEKVFLVVEELNLGNAEPQIVRKGNTAQFKTAQLLNLTLYADGIQLENNPFRVYDSPSVEEFFRDLEDGYFPSELKGCHPEGVIFKVKDKRTIRFSDDPDKRPVIPTGAKPGVKAASSPRSPTSLSSLRVASRRSDSPSRPGASKAQVGKNSKDGLEASSNLKASSLKRRSTLKKTPSRPSKPTGDVKPIDSSAEPREKSDGSPVLVPASDGSPADCETVPPSTPVSPGEGAIEGRNPIDDAATGNGCKLEFSPDGKPPGDAVVSQDSDGKPGGQIPGEGSPGDGISGDTSPGSMQSPSPSYRENTDPGKEFKELFRGNSPSSSAQRLPAHSVEPSMEAYGLPRPPFPSSSNTTADVRHLPLGPPSKQFNNFLFPKTTETQTSLTLMPGVGPGAAPQASPPPCHQPTHVTNITYNEAPITVQMTPSEFMGTKGTCDGAARPPAMQAGISCRTHHPHPCNCVRDPCALPEESKDGIFGSVGLAKFPAETEYLEKFTESAINNQNVLEFKKRSYEVKGPQSNSHSPSPTPIPRQPAATLLVGPDEAPVPPDPVVPDNLIDTNVKWPHFTYLGHPKGQGTIITPDPSTGPSPKRKPSPQVVHLNEKTSDSMVSVRMMTKSGDKEYKANVYPDEPVKKLWSLLKMNDKDYSLSSMKNPHVPLKSGSIGEISKGEDLMLVISKNDAGSEIKSRGSANSRATSEKKSFDGNASAKTRKPISSVSKEGSQVTNVNISASIGSHSSHGERLKSDSLRPSPDKKEPKPKALPSRESTLDSGNMKGSSKSIKLKEPVQDSKKSTAESQHPRESIGAHHSKRNTRASSQPQATVEEIELVAEENLGAPKKGYSFQSAFPPEITPNSSEKSFSRATSEKKRVDGNASAKTRKTISSVSKEGSQVTTVNISASIASHSSYGERSKSDSLRPSSDKKKPKPKALLSRESTLDRGSMKGSSKSIKLKEPVQDSKKSTAESQPPRESIGSPHSNRNTRASSQPEATVEKIELVAEDNLGASKKGYSFQSAFPPEITPNSSAKSFSRATSEKKSVDGNASAKTRKAISSVSKEGSQVTTVNVSASIGSHSSYGERSKSASLRPSSDKKEPKPKTLPSRESTLGRGSLKGSSKSIQLKEPIQDSKKSTTESQPPRESIGSHHSKRNTRASSQPQATVEKIELVAEENLGAPKKGYSFQSAFPPEITPTSRAKSLSKHLSVSSLHKTSFKGIQKLEVIRDTEPNLMDSPSSKVSVPRELLSNETTKRTELVHEEGIMPTKKPSLPSEKKRSIDSATFMLPPEFPRGSTISTKQSLQSQVTKISTNQSLRSQVGGVSKGDIVENLRDQAREISKSPVNISEGEAKQPDIVKDRDLAARGDVTRAKEDAPSGPTVVAADLLSLQGLKPLSQPPEFLDQIIPQAKTSGEIENHAEPQDGTNTSSSAVRKNTRARSEDDYIHGEIKNLMSSAIMGIDADNRGETTAAPGKVPNTASIKHDSPGESRNGAPKSRRKSSSSEDKPFPNREHWHPDEQPPSIRVSDVDLSHTNAPENTPVERKTPEHKTSYETSDSEHLFERNQHQAAARPPAGQQDAAIDRTGDSKQKVESANHQEKTKKGEKQDSKTYKRKSDKMKIAEEEGESAELDAAEAGDDMKSGSAESIRSKREPDDAKTTDGLEDESSTSV